MEYAYDEYSEIRNKTINLLSILTQSAKEDVILAGRELYRILPYISNLNGMSTILKEYKDYTSTILDVNTEMPKRDPYISILIPVNIEKKIKYILSIVKSKNGSRYIQWIVNKLKVSKAL